MIFISNNEEKCKDFEWANIFEILEVSFVPNIYFSLVDSNEFTVSNIGIRCWLTKIFVQ